MADGGIRKTILQPTSLPVLASDGKYYLRYRIVSEDKNSTSVWSPVYGITANAVSAITGLTPSSDYLNMVTNTYESNGSAIKLSWNIPSAIAGASFDVYAKWNANSTGSSDNDSTWNSISWTYLGTTSGNSFQYSIPTSPVSYVFSYSGTTPVEKFVKFRVQIAMAQKSVLNSATLFRTTAVSTKPTTVDGGTPSSS